MREFEKYAFTGYTSGRRGQVEQAPLPLPARPAVETGGRQGMSPEAPAKPPSPAPGTTTSALRHFEAEFHHNVVPLLGPAAEPLDSLVTGSAGTGAGLLAELQTARGDFGVASLFHEIETLAAMQSLGVPAGLLDGVPHELLAIWRTRATCSSRSELRAVHPGARLTLLAVLCRSRQNEITEALVGLLIGLVERTSERIESRLEQDCGQARHRTGAEGDLLFRLAETRNVEQPIGIQHNRTILRSTYSAHHQQVFRSILAALEFRCANRSYWPVVAVLGELVSERTACWGSPRFYDAARNLPLQGVVPARWWQAVIDRYGRVERVPYQLCVLLALRHALLNGKIHVAGAGKWDAPAGVRTSRGQAHGEAPFAGGRRDPAEVDDDIAWPAPAPGPRHLAS